jgi:hypothetical protein
MGRKKNWQEILCDRAGWASNLAVTKTVTNLEREAKVLAVTGGSSAWIKASH